MSKVGDQTAYQITCKMNYLTAWNFIKALKEKLVAQPDATIIFVTDGEKSFVDPIRSFFPDAVHIRQFHSENSRGIVYVHFPYNDKIYTLRCLWDIVVEMGTVNHRALRMRKWRKLNEKKKEVEKTSEKTKLFDGVIIWENIVYEPRGVRRKISKNATVSGAMMKKEEKQNHRVKQRNETLNSTDILALADSKSEAGNCTETKNLKYIAPVTARPKRIFEDSVEKAMQNPIATYVITILTAVFGGLYITSNAVESLFNVKPALKYHRTVKYNI